MPVALTTEVDYTADVVKIEPAEVSIKLEAKEQPTATVVKKMAYKGKKDDGKVEEKFRKLFVGGLNSATTDDSLRAFFEQWGGTLVDVIVMKDPNTKNSRGFGFVTYTSPDELEVAMKHRPHVIDDKPVETKRAAPREYSSDPAWQQTCSKIFIGGYKDDITEENLKEYFETYGGVTSVDIIGGRADSKKKGFCFVSFDDYDPVDKICLEHFHTINGHRLECKKALSKEQMAQLNQRGGSGGGRGGSFGGSARGGGGGGGGYNQGGYGGGGQGGYGGGGQGGYGGGGYGGGRGGGGGGGYGGGQGGYGGGGGAYGGAGAGGYGGGYGDGGYGGYGGEQGAYGGGYAGGYSQDQAYSGGYGGGRGGPMRQTNSFGAQRGQGPYGTGYGRGR